METLRDVDDDPFDFDVTLMTSLLKKTSFLTRCTFDVDVTFDETYDIILTKTLHDNFDAMSLLPKPLATTPLL